MFLLKRISFLLILFFCIGCVKVPVSQVEKRKDHTGELTIEWIGPTVNVAGYAYPLEFGLRSDGLVSYRKK